MALQKKRPQRGGGGGGFTHITVPQAGKIIGLFGGLTAHNDYGTAITQLRILILDSENNLEIYGPYGYETWDYTSTFAVFGNIQVNIWVL